MTEQTRQTERPPKPAALADRDDDSPAARRRLYLGAFGLLLGMFLAMLDGLIVGTALPTIVGQLGGLQQLSWVVTAYLLSSAASTPIWGKLGDLYGRKGTFMASIGLFLLGSALAGLSTDMTQLIAFRTLQGLGAGGLMVGALSILTVLGAGRLRTRLQSMIGVMMPIAFIGGPLIGGFLTDRLSWRWTFYVNLPLGGLALLLVATLVRLRTERIRARLDLLGTGLLTAGILSLTLLASVGGTRYAWSDPRSLGLAALGVLALVGFWFAERRAEEPIIPPRLFGNANFTVAQLLSLLVGAVMLAVTTCLPQYLQSGRGSSPTAAGLLLLPLLLGMLGAQLGAGRGIGRTGRYRRYPIAGGALLTTGLLVLRLVGPGTPPLATALLATVTGIGIGLLSQSCLLITTLSAPPRDLGAASGTVTLARTLGGSLGIALLGTAYADRLQASLARQLGTAAAHRLASGSHTLAPAQLRELPPAARDAFRVAAGTGLHGMLLGATVLALLTFAVSWLVREAPSGN
ncbi:MFS transporter [Kitasatospora kifunensis]|uniref:EmrB/QacA subfamily drug resistance transporter n=1 Tax=Kitasatospora kifunensis TaxID=58351 RepID=A0A7W7R3G2_KITKI|nr:MFS transporter [Kitasatospora kifunensis]MBB4924707.1 EmrB/QacA subfamily drug resistance transporter [Kitasatospora kifunensis]